MCVEPHGIYSLTSRTIYLAINFTRTNSNYNSSSSQGGKVWVRRIKSRLTGDESSPSRIRRIQAIDIKGIFVPPLSPPRLSALHFWILKQYRFHDTGNRCNDQLCSWRETTARHDQFELKAFAFKCVEMHTRWSGKETLTFETKIGIA